MGMDNSADLNSVPPVEEIQPGLWSMPQPMPGPLGYVIVYALEVDNAVLLIDSGWDAPEGLAYLEAALKTFGAALADVRGALFTHWHIDHYGLAGRLRDETGAWIALHEIEAALIARRADEHEATEDIRRWLGSLGVRGDERSRLNEAATARRQRYKASVAPDRLLVDGASVEADGWRLEVLCTPGHSPGHVCFVVPDRGVIFTGDHVLSYTTPNVSVMPYSTASPLDDYLRSLRRVLALGGLLGLPGHEARMQVAPRCAALLVHHDEQLRNAGDLVAAGHETVRAVATRMPWSRPWEELGSLDRTAALGEAHAHLVALERHGELELVATDPWRWRPKGLRSRPPGTVPAGSQRLE